MKHPKSIAERLAYLGGSIGENLKEMIERDKKDEETAAMRLYKRTVEMTQKEQDITTARLFRKILEDEEDHHNFFTSLLEEI